ncbi:MAG: hypothetical protein ACK4KV_21545, partial [Rhodocyclaceae bacterium]
SWTSPFGRIDESSRFPSWHSGADYRNAVRPGRGSPFHSLEGMDGSVHQVGLDIARLSPEMARYIERLAAVPEGPARSGTASR